ncbi:MAG TPA: FHA domain-containing protein [Bdellovibrionota bacterium]|nr:FHA domain-containing protein [Bdellovibrionota bacterium]
MGAAPILNILRNGEMIRSVPIEGEAILGRSEGCVIRLEDRAISRQHVVFRLTGDGVQVEKKSEFAPLLVNGRDCTKALLKEGDVLSLGPYVLQLKIAEVATEAPAGATAPVLSVNNLPQLGNKDPTRPLETQDQSVAPEPGPNAELAGLDLPLNGSPDAAPHATEHPDLEANSLGGKLELIDPVAEGGEPEIAQADEQQPAPGSGDPPALVPAEAIEISEVILADSDAPTKVAPLGRIAIKLIFKPGEANVEEFELTQDEITIGRGKNCEIVLNDKKASRKNTLIRKSGMNFVIKDLDSANGTFVNGTKITEQELTGDDKIRIGEIEFLFQASSVDFKAQEKNFMSLQPAEQPPEQPPEQPNDQPAESLAGLPEINLPQLTESGAKFELPPSHVSLQAPKEPPPVSGPNMSRFSTGPITGIVGVGPGRKATLLEKFRAQPKPRQFLIASILFLVLWWAMEDETPRQNAAKQQPKTRPSAMATEKLPPTYENLTPEQKKFVETQRNMAWDYFKNSEFDKALYELNKVLEILPGDEKAREIQRYATQEKRKIEALHEEKKKREEEARLKAKIAQLTEEIRERMKKKDYEQAKELFSQVLALDPDSQDIAAWKKELEEYEEQKRLREQEREIRAQINRQAWTTYQEGLALKKQQKHHGAIALFRRIFEMGATDKKVTVMASRRIAQSRAAIAAKREPIMQEATQLEESGELAKAFQLYEKAVQVDPTHRAAHAGMDRLKGILHDRAKGMYTEAVLAESYSDFAVAKKKFEECLSTAPRDDIYYERAQRKLSHYFKKDEPLPP